MQKNNLKLLCKNQEGLKVISAYTQDSIVAVKDIVFLKQNRIFIMMLNRFMWENIEKGISEHNQRIRCAIKFEEVLKVQSKEINQKSRNKNLECLAIKCNEISDNNYEIKIFFSGNSIITLISETIEVVMHDIGKAWNVKHIPEHKI
tara:strand:+ start:301 stop:741 length:441 start_codon:yes stop_codon:yes gene_type:complete